MRDHSGVLNGSAFALVAGDERGTALEEAEGCGDGA
jgi:hypothetical protein